MATLKIDPTPQRYWDDEDWLDEHIMDITRQYPDMWVGVVNKKIVSSGENLGDVIKKAIELTGESHIFTHFVEKGMRIYADRPEACYKV